MNRLPRFAPWILIAVAAALCLAVCCVTQGPLIPNVSAAVAAAQDQAPPDQGQDPAAVNMAPSGPSYTTEAPPLPSRQALRRALTIRIMPSSPRRRLPSLLRRCPATSSLLRPGDGYIWTPGYWAWGPARLLLGSWRMG